MKKLILAILLVIAGLQAINARAEMKSISVYDESGQQVTKVYNLDDFSAIGCEGIAHIVFTQSNNYSIKATGTKSYIDNLIIKVENKSLVVRMKKNAKLNSGRNNKNNLTIYISAPKLSSLSLSGVASFSCKALKGDSFVISTSGVSKINCPSLEFNKLTSKVSGASSTNFTCKAGVVEIINSGASKCDIKLDCEKLIVDNSGVGMMRISGTADKTDIHSSGVSKVDISDLNKY